MAKSETDQWIMTERDEWIMSQTAPTLDGLKSNKQCHLDEAIVFIAYLKGEINPETAAQEITRPSTNSSYSARLMNFFVNALNKLDEDTDRILALLVAIQNLPSTTHHYWYKLPGFGRIWQLRYRTYSINNPKDLAFFTRMGTLEAKMYLLDLHPIDHWWVYRVMNLICLERPDLEEVIYEVHAWLEVAGTKIAERIQPGQIKSFERCVRGRRDKTYEIQVTMYEHWEHWKKRFLQILFLQPSHIAQTSRDKMTDTVDNESVNDLAGQTSGLGIVDGNDESKQPQTFAAAINHLGQTTASLLQDLANIETLFPGSEHLFAETPTIRIVNQLANGNKFMSEALNSAAIEIILTRITSLKSSRTPETQGLLNHFDGSIQAIVQKFVAQPCDADPTWKIIEECCIQAVPSGQLDPNEFLATREGLSEETKDDVREEWARFWSQTMNSCADGPTLFAPPKLPLQFETSQPPPHMDPLACDWSEPLHPHQNTPKLPPSDLPRFLFRAHDMDGTLNNEDTIASWGYHAYGPKHAKRDIFSLSKGIASKMLFKHLNGGERTTPADNLVSWSSSLLYAIKSANCPSAEQSSHRVFICVLDTTKFPKSQFMSATRLRDNYDGACLDLGEILYIQQRSDSPKYDIDGEYLSQGTLNITGGSCTIPLPKLHCPHFGLGALYRDLDISVIDSHPEHMKMGCVERLTVELRQKWKAQCTTTAEEIRTAMRIARVVSRSFDELDFALMLLAFRERKIEGELEVVRYMALKDRLARLRESGVVNTFKCLEELFVLKSTDAQENGNGDQGYRIPVKR
ncbi:hypothetical protein FIE12Z_6263 [Fusarium flagelliforme]|uniref:DUF7587 domain-containing protein n=1 Tax=Fusarium flagelliforme TaxID=2675880 RepID=A0A395MNF4_9HYPO|nr:hypothetical protein FIE12Z_6263 [Fusarium flagelliforme]